MHCNSHIQAQVAISLASSFECICWKFINAADASAKGSVEVLTFKVNKRIWMDGNQICELVVQESLWSQENEKFFIHWTGKTANEIIEASLVPKAMRRCGEYTYAHSHISDDTPKKKQQPRP